MSPMDERADIPGLDALLAPWEGPAILLVDLDAFFASVEQLDHPGWRGKPVIVGGDADKHGVVSTCSYEARAFGVRDVVINYVDPVIGAHSGPGTMALFFLADHR